MPTPPSFLVIGNAATETVTRTENGAVRAGGIGAIMARELALAGADVTLLTTALPGKPLENIRRHISAAGATLDVEGGNPPQKTHALVQIRCRRGEFAGATGQWARMGGLGRRIATSAPEFDVTLVSLNLTPNDLQAALRHSRRLVANATSNKLAPRLLNLKGLAAATLNTRELGAVRAQTGSRGKPEELAGSLEAEQILLTRGANGMSLFTKKESRAVPAPPVPAGTDFIGAGDAATAGLASALATELDPLETASHFVTGVLDRNARSYR